MFDFTGKVVVITGGAKGIGKAIYAEILRYAKMRKCYNVTLNVWSCNENAMRFDQSLGLKPQKIGMEAILED